MAPAWTGRADTAGMREQPAFADGPQRLLLPSCLAAFLPFALLWLPPAHWHPRPLIAAAALTVAIAAVMLRGARKPLPRWGAPGLAWAYLIVVSLLRASGGPSGVAVMALLPVFWLGLRGTRGQLWWLLIGVALVFVVPVVVVGGAAYPPSAWRAAILFVTLSGIVGTTVQALVTHTRGQERERNRLLGQLNELAHTDALTGLPNRRAWQSELDRGLARARRTGEPVSVAVIDIDKFKAVNDTHGHPGGDSLLTTVARSWSDARRPDDVLARIGGDEFAVLMPGCGRVEAADLSCRLRALMPSPYTCSIGLATWEPPELPYQLMQRADNALYDAKRNGHDRAPAAASGGSRATVA
jgi:diguanylate cyclase (GGDEF)-like protein